MTVTIDAVYDYKNNKINPRAFSTNSPLKAGQTITIPEVIQLDRPSQEYGLLEGAVIDRITIHLKQP